MNQEKCVVVLGTFDSKGEEHLFLRDRIQARGLGTITINIGTKAQPSFSPDFDLFAAMQEDGKGRRAPRDGAIREVVARAVDLVQDLHSRGKIAGIVSAGGGTGTHMGTSVMRMLPMGIPKVMVSTVAAKDMKKIVGTKDITMMHSVVDLLGVNSVSGMVLDRAAGAVCGMARDQWRPGERKKRIALTFFGFITQSAEFVKQALNERGYEVIAFHANGTGGMAMEELAAEGYFDGILDLATHELADELKGGYCSGIGPSRLQPHPGTRVPRLVVPGGLDCAVLEFTRETIPPEYEDRKIFFYDFRSAIRLDERETVFIARQLAEKLNSAPSTTRVMIPLLGWSEADGKEGPLFDPALTTTFIETLKQKLNPEIQITEEDFHINDHSFAESAARAMDEMVSELRAKS
jgi:uncharacterized protein (UPF0261 family)